MIIGNGLIATAFKQYANNDDIILFASGVSNSKEVLKSEFFREEKLLRETINKYFNKKIIYFSTCSMYDTYFEMSEYTKHKIKMEEIILENVKQYTIFRLPQVLGKNNKKQLIGFLYEQIKNKKSFDLFSVERNIIDIEDICLLVNEVLKNITKSEIINIANINNIKVIDLVNIIEILCKEKAKYTLKNIEGNFNININRMKPIIVKKRIFEENYIENRIRKYYE